MDDLILNSNGLSISPVYSISIIMAFILVFVFPLTKDFDNQKEKKQYFYLQAITFIGAIFGAKLAVLMGDALWPTKPFNSWLELFISGKSIVGALLFGFIFAEIAKPLMSYQRLPNDRFAIIIPFSIAIGRVGCWFSGCCLGIESTSPFSMTHIDKLNRYPIALIEIAFHVIIGLILISFFRRKKFQGQIFAIFMMLYGTFRFFSEYIRATEKAFWGYSAYQLFALLLIAAGLISFIARTTKTTGVNHATG